MLHSCRHKERIYGTWVYYYTAFKVDIHSINGIVRFKNANNCLNTNIYSYVETSGGQSYNLYLNAVNFFNTSLN